MTTLRKARSLLVCAVVMIAIAATLAAPVFGKDKGRDKKAAPPPGKVTKSKPHPTGTRPHLPSPATSSSSSTAASSSKSGETSAEEMGAHDRAPHSDSASDQVAGGMEGPSDGFNGTTSTKAAKTKVYTFGAMDVEGKLKTPQLLYFLNRVRLELEMSAPDRRSFMKELEKTAEDPHL